MKTEAFSAEASSVAAPDVYGPVLVVDDSKLQRKILSSTLKRLGHAVTECATAAEALQLCEQGHTSIVISDWMMPGMNGLEFCQELRSLASENYIYFILLTSKSDEDAVARGFDSGADDFLPKPVSRDELRARMSAAHRILDMQKALREKTSLVEATLEELRTIYGAVDRDLIEARKFQHSLIKEPEQSFGGATLRMFLKSSGRVGGDLVGSYPIDSDSIGIYSIDVSGHGVASALLSARIAGYLSPSAPDQNIALKRVGRGYQGVTPSKAVAALNRLMLEEIDTELYFTIALAQVHLRTGQVQLCQAGHPPPVIQRQDGSVEFFGNGGFPVGLIASAVFNETQSKLRSGDRLLMYSDGVTECSDAVGNMLDARGLVDVLGRSHKAREKPFFDMLLDTLHEFSGGKDLGDDVSALMLDFDGRTA